MMEDHIIPFLRMWGVGCGFYGEQGGESLHKTINSMGRNYTCIKNDLAQLKYVMNNHLASTNPRAASIRVVKQARKRKST